MERPKMPLPQLIFGEVIYWLCIVAAIICTVGPVIAMLSVGDNVMNPHYLFTAIWEGKSASVVWEEVGGGFPGGHFWLQNFTIGDGFAQFGLVLGCACALPALLAIAVAYLWEKPRGYVWTLLSLWIASLITISLLGILQV